MKYQIISLKTSPGINISTIRERYAQPSGTRFPEGSVYILKIQYPKFSRFQTILSNFTKTQLQKILSKYLQTQKLHSSEIQQCFRKNLDLKRMNSILKDIYYPGACSTSPNVYRQSWFAALMNSFSNAEFDQFKNLMKHFEEKLWRKISTQIPQNIPKNIVNIFSFLRIENITSQKCTSHTSDI